MKSLSSSVNSSSVFFVLSGHLGPDNSGEQWIVNMWKKQESDAVWEARQERRAAAAEAEAREARWIIYFYDS